MTAPYLTEAEIADLCAPLVQPAAQARALKALGLLVKRKPNGHPLVARCEFERVMTGQQPGQPAQNRPPEATTTTGDVIGLQAWARTRKGGNGGKEAQGR